LLFLLLPSLGKASKGGISSKRRRKTRNIIVPEIYSNFKDELLVLVD
jgi:hypothetical protein